MLVDPIGLREKMVFHPVFFAPASATELPDALWEYGLRPPPAFLEQRPAAAEVVVLLKGNQSIRWAGRVYLDGSGLEPRLPELRRCGWALVLSDDQGH